MELVYFGKKRPFRIQTISPAEIEEAKRRADGVTYIPLDDVLSYPFDPFKAIEVDDRVAKILLDNAGDIFKRIDKEERKPDPTPKVKTDGYVGDVHADTIPNLKKQVERDIKTDEGKSVEEMIEEEVSRRKRGRPKKEEVNED